MTLWTLIGNWSAVKRHERRLPDRRALDPSVVAPMSADAPPARPVFHRPLVVLTSSAVLAQEQAPSPSVDDDGVGTCLTAGGVVADCSGGTAIYRIVGRAQDASGCGPSEEIFTRDNGAIYCAESIW